MDSIHAYSRYIPTSFQKWVGTQTSAESVAKFHELVDNELFEIWVSQSSVIEHYIWLWILMEFVCDFDEE